MQTTFIVAALIAGIVVLSYFAIKEYKNYMNENYEPNMWVHIKKRGGGSWWQRKSELPKPMPKDWKILATASAPADWWNSK